MNLCILFPMFYSPKPPDQVRILIYIEFSLVCRVLVWTAENGTSGQRYMHTYTLFQLEWSEQLYWANIFEKEKYLNQLNYYNTSILLEH